jgi:transposase InsO family protein
VFTAYVAQVLAPTLTKGDIVVLDNLGSHKGKTTRAAIRARSAHMLFLPPCSPDLNPIEQVFAKLNHPWTNGQVERMNRTIKDATVKRCHYDSHEMPCRHLDDFVSAYNFGRRLKTLKGLTPWEFICKCWTSEPHRFNLHPIHHMPGLNTRPDMSAPRPTLRTGNPLPPACWR